MIISALEITICRHPAAVRARVLRAAFAGACRGGLPRADARPLRSAYVRGLERCLRLQDAGGGGEALHGWDPLYHTLTLSRLLAGGRRADEASGVLERAVARQRGLHEEPRLRLGSSKRRAVRLGQTAVLLRQLWRFPEAAALLEEALAEWPEERHRLAGDGSRERPWGSGGKLLDPEGFWLRLVAAQADISVGRAASALPRLQRLSEGTTCLTQRAPHIYEGLLGDARLEQWTASGALALRREKWRIIWQIVGILDTTSRSYVPPKARGRRRGVRGRSPPRGAPHLSKSNNY